MSDRCKHGNFDLRCMLEEREDQLAEARAEVERLSKLVDDNLVDRWPRLRAAERLARAVDAGVEVQMADGRVYTVIDSAEFDAALAAWREVAG